MNTGIKKQIISIDRSYNLVNDLKKQMQGEIRVESNYQTDAISNRISSVYQAGGS